jgi:hypothetical protein
MSRLTVQYAEIRQDELDGLHTEIRRLRELIVQIGYVINCIEYGSEQACVDVGKLISDEICLHNAPITGPSGSGAPPLLGGFRINHQPIKNDKP